ncbi:macro domain-like protein [Amniculicola lignicola CBS 123094]|uniref:Macro domain-like protein n=1 Tax=Amniculicola lignicola CBS 123094 TaxID=1392246 RepID=A0A6A5WBR0_9PLEO|nr:macro domain-like protein [Amniculicola lignicola CBS 123094]
MANITSSSTSEATTPPIPSIHILCMEEKFITAWTTAAQTYNLPSINVTLHHDRLAELPSSVKFDAIVSPANSFGRMDGGFDDALSRAFSPKEDYYTLTRVVQERLYAEWRGFAPPGSCTMVDLETPPKRGALKPNDWGCRYIALCPTMKIPQNVLWDREVVYECIWALLASVGNHNRKVDRGDGNGKDAAIRSMLMTPIATGYGRWSPERWAAQTVLAMKHYAEAAENEEKWHALGPFKAVAHSEELDQTYKL